MAAYISKLIHPTITLERSLLKCHFQCSFKKASELMFLLQLWLQHRHFSIIVYYLHYHLEKKNQQIRITIISPTIKTAMKNLQISLQLEIWSKNKCFVDIAFKCSLVTGRRKGESKDTILIFQLHDKYAEDSLLRLVELLLSQRAKLTLRFFFFFNDVMV